MEVQVQEQGSWGRRLAIEVPAERVEREWEKVVDEYRRRAVLPGFRKGKAPTEVIRTRFEGDIEGELLDRLVSEAFGEALRKVELEPAIPADIGEVQFRLGEPLRFVAQITVRPRFEVQGIRDLALEQEIFEIDDEAVAGALEALRRNRADLVEVDRPARDGDLLVALLEPVDVHGKRLPGAKREEVRLEVGSGTLLPEFREAAEGALKGVPRDVGVAYPSDLRDPELAGKRRRYRFTPKQILEKKLPELDDNFARGIDPALDLEGLKAKLRLRLESQELVRSKERLEERVVEQLDLANPLTVPEEMVGVSLRRLLARARQDDPGADEEAMRRQWRPVVERMHRKSLLLENLKRQESLALGEEEIEAQLEAMARDAGVDVSVIREKMEEEGELEQMVDTMQERKVIDFLVGSAKITRVRKPRPAQPEPPSRIIVP